MCSCSPHHVSESQSLWRVGCQALDAIYFFMGMAESSLDAGASMKAPGRDLAPRPGFLLPLQQHSGPHEHSVTTFEQH